MRFPYSTSDPAQNEFDSLPRLPFVLMVGNQSLSVTGLVDSGSTVNVLPYQTGLQLDAKWDNRRATIPLAGTFGNLKGIPFFAQAKVGDFQLVRLAFVWVKVDSLPLILGQTNFFMLFDICFYRSRLEFEISPKQS